MSIKNSKGEIFYGMHFYPGVAQYLDKSGKNYKIFINEATIRKMDPNFAGKPLFVEHVNDVNANPDELRKEADGWVIESFFNQADGKHWVKFIAVTEKANEAIKKGFRLSNAYFPVGHYGPGGTWNGVPYEKQLMNGDFEHLAIVQNPRYEESVIMTPEQFKKYNERLELELERIANSKDKEPIKEKNSMKLNFWKKDKVENATELEGVMVTLPESKKSMTVAEALEIADKHLNMAGYASGEHMVKVGDDEMSVNDLAKKYCKMNEEADDEVDVEEKKNKKKNKKKNDDDVVDNADDEDDMENEDDDDKIEEKKNKKKNKKKNSSEDEDDEIVENDDEVAIESENEHFKALKNAHAEVEKERGEGQLDLSENKVARGVNRYGSDPKK